MGTRALTVFKNEGKVVARVYRQFDGGLEWHGKELAQIIDRKICNGFTLADKEAGNVSNGLECLAAHAVSKLKTEIGGIYLVSSGDHGAQYTYTVTIENNQVHMVVKEGKKLLFSGSPAKFLTQ